MRSNKYHGFTLVELMVTILIAGVVLTIAIPNFSSFVSDAKVVGAVEKIKVDMEWARTQAVRSNKNIIMKFQSSGANWCYGFDDTDNNCDCTSNNCTVDNVVNTKSNQQFSGTTLNIAFDNGQQLLTLSSRGLTDTKGTLTITQDSDTAQITINDLGRGHICSNQLSQFPSCQ